MSWRQVIIVTSLLTLAQGSDDEYIRHRAGRHKRDLSGRIIKTSIIPSEPYLMQVSTGQYEGIIPDLLAQIEKRLQIKFEKTLVPDGRYGTQDNSSDVKWNGMIGEILKRDADPDRANGVDIAAAPITITSKREQVVNFIKPFQHVGLTILVKKPHMEDSFETFPVHFQVLAPFATETWALCFLAYAVVAAVIWAMNKINPYEWGGRYNLGRATEHQAETFNLSGSLWFTFTTLQWQGYERSPRSCGSRVMASFWFIFVTITLVTFTGSLVNHLFWVSTVHGKNPLAFPFRNMADLVNSDYEYGMIKGGSSYQYVTNAARGDEFKVMTKYFESEKGKKNLFSSSLDGVARAREGKFAFICETGFANHYVNKKPCDLMTTAAMFAPRAYGIAISQKLDHELTEALHTVILDLHEEGEMEAIENKWYVDKGECWNVTKMENQVSQISALYLNKPKRISPDMFWGPLVLLLVGVILSLLVGVAEVFYYKYKGRYDSKNRPGSTQLKLDDDGM